MQKKSGDFSIGNYEVGRGSSRRALDTISRNQRGEANLPDDMQAGGVMLLVLIKPQRSVSLYYLIQHRFTIRIRSGHRKKDLLPE